MKIKLVIQQTQIVLLSILLFTGSALFAGNKDRVGQAGASELTINPWARSSGLAGANTASAMGIEATSLNVAGLAFTNKTDIQFTRTSWLKGSGININAIGFGQRLGESSVLGISITAMSFGDIEITTVNQPEGGNGTYSPQYQNFGLSYAKAFSNSISGGITVRVISETMANLSTRGVAGDIGIRYVTGDYNRIKFGIALKNFGPKMKYSGDGLSTPVTINNESYNLDQKTEGFDLPTQLTMGVSYDIYISPQSDSTRSYSESPKSDHKVVLNGTFTANAFGKDQLIAGVEYEFRSLIQVRAGYLYETRKNEGETTSNLTNAFNGPTAGASVVVPLGAKGNKLAIDYSYRSTVSFSGTHSIGIRLNM